MDEELKKIGQRIRDNRISLGISQIELAERLGVMNSYLSQVEKGRRYPNVNLILKVCKELDINASTLFGEKLTEESDHWISFGKSMEEKGITLERLITLIEDVEKFVEG